MTQMTVFKTNLTKLTHFVLMTDLAKTKRDGRIAMRCALLGKTNLEQTFFKI